MASALLPPGPPGRWITGNLPDFRRDPLRYLPQWAREYGGIVGLRFFRLPVYLLAHPDYIEYVYVTNNRNFIKSKALRQNRRILGNGLLTSEGDFWRRQRRLAQPAFHRERINAYSTVMVAYTERLLANWRDGATLDVHQEMMRLTLEIVAKTLFDADVAGEAVTVGQALTVALEHFNARTNSLIPIPEGIPTPANRRFEQAARRLDEIVYGIIERRRASGEDRGDLLSMLLQAQDEDGSQMTAQQLRDEAMTLFLAGHETTANALAWTFYLLAQNPAADAKLAAELREVLGGRAPTLADLPRLKYTEMVILESMRIYPPAWITAREAVGDCEIGGYPVKAGSLVILAPWVMHRHPDYFDQPEVFNPDRWANDLVRRLPNFAYFPFGGGPRLCIGKPFAMMEAVLLLAAIAQQYRLSLVPGHPVEPFPSVTLRPKHGIRMVLSRR